MHSAPLVSASSSCIYAINNPSASESSPKQQQQQQHNNNNNNNRRRRSSTTSSDSSHPPRSVAVAAAVALAFDEMLRRTLMQQHDRTSSSISGGGGGGGDGIMQEEEEALQDVVAECGMALWQGRWERSRELIRQLWRRSSTEGDAVERMASHFADIFAARLQEACASPAAAADRHIFHFSDNEEEEEHIQQRLRSVSAMAMTTLMSEDGIQSASLSLNQATPYLRFAHLTANQAILEAMEGKQSVHIVDLEIMQGLQWPPLMQAMAERSGGAPRRIIITAGGRDAGLLDQVGERLRRFAESVGFDSGAFQYESLEYGGADVASQRRLLDDVFQQLENGGEECMVVINCILLQVGDLPWATETAARGNVNDGGYNYSSMRSSSDEHMNPSRRRRMMMMMSGCRSSSGVWGHGRGGGAAAINNVDDGENNNNNNNNGAAAAGFHSPSALLWEMVTRIGGGRWPAAAAALLATVAEPEAELWWSTSAAGRTSMKERFGAAVRHYAALFESLEATLPPGCGQRGAVEGVWVRSQVARLMLGAGLVEGGRGMLLHHHLDLQHHQQQQQQQEVYVGGGGAAPAASSWREVLARSGGWRNVAPSTFAQSQARLLLRLRYASEGYVLDVVNNDRLVLGWQETPLYAVSAWRCYASSAAASASADRGRIT